MKITFISNYFNHHQSPLANALARKEGIDFFFVETMSMREERRKLGYGEKEYPPYVLDYKKNSDHHNVKKLIEISDVVICGSAPTKIRALCKKSQGILFRCSERPLKRGLEPLKYIPRLIRWRHINPPSRAIFLLCAGAYVAGDYAKFGLFQNRTYQWGYFPETIRYDDFDKLMREKDTTRMMWCGRFLDWKHPDHAILVAKKLKDEGYSFALDLVGCGEMAEKLHRMIEKEGLSDCVTLLGPMSPREVRIHMEKVGIFLLTSNRQEGWGAVLNEAMNSGCAVVASHAIGAVPYLLRDGENGYIYESDNIDMLCEKAKDLLEHPDKQIVLGGQAYNTIVKEWNAEVAADRFVRMAEKILVGEEALPHYESGPCSRAEDLYDKWQGS